MDGGSELVPSSGRTPERDAGAVPGAGAQVQQSQTPHQRVPAEVSAEELWIIKSQTQYNDFRDYTTK